MSAVSTRAKAVFTIDLWDQETVDEAPGGTIARAHLTKTFHGDIEGTTTADIMMAGSASGGSSAYVGFERFTVSVHGRSGTFVLHHNATSVDGQQSATWSVVPDTGTDGLTGLRGQAQIIIEPDGGHTFVLDYDLD
jgi:hypothetical protein